MGCTIQPGKPNPQIFYSRQYVVISRFITVAGMYKLPIFILMMTAMQACKKEGPEGPLAGRWRGSLTVMDGRELPFNFKLVEQDSSFMAEIYNAGEVLKVDEIWFDKDSIYFQMPVFEDYIAASFQGTTLSGSLINESRRRRVPFRAQYGDLPRFPDKEKPLVDVSGEWQATFNPDAADRYPAKGIFTQEGGQVHGTFRTKTGDRRYLEGVVSGDSLKLSTFDGAHAYLFVAKVTDSLMRGMYYSGNHYKEPFEARRNPGYELPDEDSLTFLKPGYDRLEFAFPDSRGDMVSLGDDQFRDKVVVVQLMGTWCPNCLDETKFLAAYLKGNGQEDLKVVALAFEYYKTPEKSFEAIDRLKARLGLDYPILLAQYGGADKLQANSKLPMLDRVLSYPTTIFIDRRGKVRRIHTGFNGPATGRKYTEFQEEFDRLIKQLLAE